MSYTRSTSAAAMDPTTMVRHVVGSERNRLAVSMQTLQIPGDRFLDVVDHFATRIPLRNATRKRRNFSDVNAVFVLLNEDTILHSTHLRKS